MQRREKDANTEVTAALVRMTGTKPPKDGKVLAIRLSENNWK